MYSGQVFRHAGQAMVVSNVGAVWSKLYELFPLEGPSVSVLFKRGQRSKFMPEDGLDVLLTNLHVVGKLFPFTVQ